MNRKLITGMLAILAVFSQSSTIAQSVLSPEQLSQQIRELNERSQNSASAISGMQADVKKMSRLLDNRAMLELMQSVEGLASEVSQLRGELEEQGHDITELKKRQRELYLDIDRRLRNFDSSASVAPASVAPTVSDNNTQAIVPAQGVSPPEPATSNGLISDNATTTNTAAIQPITTNTVSSSQEQAAYQAAFDTLKEGRYRKAKTEFKRFLEKYPTSSYAGNAQYWLGEAYFVTRDFDQGIAEFKMVMSRYPTSTKVADAMLKLGFTYYEKKQFEASKQVLRDLNNRFPKSTAARLAVKRLDRIRKEGN